MPTREFWNEEPNLLWTYLSLYNKKIQQKQEEMDFYAWLQGAYVCKAIACCFAKGQKYPKEPIFIKQQAMQKQSKQNVANKIKASLQKNKEILDMRGRKQGQKTM